MHQTTLCVTWNKNLLQAQQSSPWRWSKCLLVVMAAGGGGGLQTDVPPVLHVAVWTWDKKVNELNVDTLTHHPIYLAISPSLPLFSLWRMLYQQQRMKNDSSKSMMSSSSFLRRITGQCRGTLPPFCRLGNCHITDQLCVSVNVKIEGILWCQVARNGII